MKNINLTYIGKKIAYFSSITGTVILVLFLLSKSELFVTAGLYFLLTAFIINSLLFLCILLEFLGKPADWRVYLVTMLRMLINIPLSILYCHVAISFHL
ncbi:hypothetical protein [Pedobacter sp.]|uniref:hypothetical protein n=1 Tax=Pedobacter sp. TaxID=1411316 RepID=UPI003BAB688E